MSEPTHEPVVFDRIQARGLTFVNDPGQTRIELRAAGTAIDRVRESRFANGGSR